MREELGKKKLIKMGKNVYHQLERRDSFLLGKWCRCKDHRHKTQCCIERESFLIQYCC